MHLRPPVHYRPSDCGHLVGSLAEGPAAGGLGAAG